MYASTNEDDEVIRDKKELLLELNKYVKLAKGIALEKDIEVDKFLGRSKEEQISLLDKYTNAVLENEEYKKKFLSMVSELISLYSSVLPEPDAQEYYDFVTAMKVIASRVQEVGRTSIPIDRVKRDLEELLDRSIQTGEYLIPQHKKITDLSKLDANALKKFFEDIENKNIQIEKTKTDLQVKLEAMVKQNPSRFRFIERFNSLLDSYNSGTHNNEKLFEDLVELAKDLEKEEDRHKEVGLSEDELAIFDLIKKEDSKSEDKIKSASRIIIDKLKNERLVLDWREKESTRAAVKNVIYDSVYKYLPESEYSDQDCEKLGADIYNFIYERYGNFTR